MQRIVVLLPDPLGPRNPVTRPGWTSKLRSSTATTRPKRLVRSRISIIDGQFSEASHSSATTSGAAASTSTCTISSFSVSVSSWR